MHTKKYIYKYVCLFFIFLSWFAYADDEIIIPGFGNQPVNVEKNVSTKSLIQKILGNIPYKLTPGDTYKIIVQMDETFSQTLVLDENYKLEIPFIGTMQVKDKFFSDLRQDIIRQIKAERVVDFVDFTLVAPALFEVFIYGGVEQPGMVTVTAVNTVWEAIVLTKGFKKGGSYRQIKLIRNKKEYILDLGKYIREGDLEQNPRVEPGDRIYVPHASIVAEIKGHVRYADIFELLPGESLFDLIQMAGGYLPDANKSLIQVNRTNEDGTLRIEYVEDSTISRFLIKNGDIIFIKSALENREMILLEGALYGKPTKGTGPQNIPDKPLMFNIPYINGITLLQVLDTYGGPTNLANVEKSYIRRKATGEKIEIDVKNLWDTKNPELDVELKPEDHIVIPIKPTRVIVAGEVNIPGSFHFQSSTVVSDYIKLAGGIIFEKGDPKRIFFIDSGGRKTPVNLDTEVPPGSLIYVDRRALEKVAYTAGKFAVIVSLVASIVSITVDVTSIIKDLRQ